MKTFYNALISAFNNTDNIEKYTRAGLKAPRIIDLYNGQDFNPEYFDMLTLPALYVSMRIDYNENTAILSLDFKLLYEQLRNTSNFSLSSENALKFFDLANITDEIIKSISTNKTGSLRLLNEGLEPEPTVTDAYLLSYECEYYGKQKTRERETLSGSIDDIKIKSGLYKGLL
ncbi:hypothetical protein GO491_07635 [Flavobacteriaceae bacterium Ap0902]|nr:hypothetical protein [Flavobacteriaceae bacterium Ap0902]